jgi:hypothetical protein
MITPIVVGLMGDVLTFVGAGILALEAFSAEKELRKRRGSEIMISSGDLQETGMMVRIGDHRVKTLGELEELLVHSRAVRGRWGLLLVTLGFLLLVAHRLLELWLAERL